ncbi:MAG: hypothetical protein MHM6MM_000125 [Cercozoa sp. M6MM]
MGLFPNAKEISETTAAIFAASTHLKSIVKLNSRNTTGISVGDGVAPRTSAFAAYRTKWRRQISIDPILRPEDAPWRSIRGLHCMPKKVEEVEIPLVLPLKEESLENGTWDEHIVIFLVHAHVTPEMAVAALQLPEDYTDRRLPTVSIIQVACCDWIYYDRCFMQAPDVEYDDGGIASVARRVRVWRDVMPLALQHKGVRVGDIPAKEFSAGHLHARELKEKLREQQMEKAPSKSLIRRAESRLRRKEKRKRRKQMIRDQKRREQQDDSKTSQPASAVSRTSDD